CTYVTVDGLRAFNAQTAAVRVDAGNHVTVRNGVFGNNGTWGILTDFTPDLLLENNEVYGSVNQHGIYGGNSNGPNDNPVLRGNNVHDNNGAGIQLNGDCMTPDPLGVTDAEINGAILEGNYLHDNAYKAFSLISAPGVIVRNNVIANNGVLGG